MELLTSEKKQSPVFYKITDTLVIRFFLGYHEFLSSDFQYVISEIPSSQDKFLALIESILTYQEEAVESVAWPESSGNRQTIHDEFMQLRKAFREKFNLKRFLGSKKFSYVKDANETEGTSEVFCVVIQKLPKIEKNFNAV